MKRTIIRLLVLAMVVITASSCTSTMGQRVMGGFQQIISSPFQVSQNIRTEMPKAKFQPIGAAGGAVKGSFDMTKQIVNGVMTILTFFRTK